MSQRFSRYRFTIVFFLTMILLHPPMAADAFPATQGRAYPKKKIEIDGGSVSYWGGILASPGFKIRMTKRKEHVKTELGIAVINHTGSTIWVEITLPPTQRGKKRRKFKKVETGKRQSFEWGLKKEDIRWGEEYPFTISIFTDKKSKTLAGSESDAFFFTGSSRSRLEELSERIVEDVLRMEFRSYLVYGWPDQWEKVAEFSPSVGGKPPFEWEDDFADPGVSFTITEKGRELGRSGSTNIIYRLRATGFAPGEDLVLWQKYLDATFEGVSVSVDESGLVTVALTPELRALIPPGTDPAKIHIDPDFKIDRMLAGQSFNMTLYSPETKKRAHAKVFPFPIEAQGKGGCSAMIEILSERGYLFGVVFEGFEPGEKVTFTSRYKKEKLSDTTEVPEAGTLQFPILYGPPDRGTATVSAEGANCRVSLEYKVGKDAAKPR